jgi:hypothetical protein
MGGPDPILGAARGAGTTLYKTGRPTHLFRRVVKAVRRCNCKAQPTLRRHDMAQVASLCDEYATKTDGGRTHMFIINLDFYSTAHCIAAGIEVNAR